MSRVCIRQLGNNGYDECQLSIERIDNLKSVERGRESEGGGGQRGKLK